MRKTPPNVILLTGKARSGKDTVFSLMRQHSDYDLERLAFADKLKEIATEAGWDGSKNSIGRRILIDIGSIGRGKLVVNEDYVVHSHPSVVKVVAAAASIMMKLDRDFDENYWTESIVNTILANPEKKYVITDTRFLNEIQAIEQVVEEVVVARVVRLRMLSIKDASETELDNYTYYYIVPNDGSRAELEDTVLELCKTLNLTNQGDEK